MATIPPTRFGYLGEVGRCAGCGTNYLLKDGHACTERPLPPQAVDAGRGALRACRDALVEYVESDVVHWEQSHATVIDDWWGVQQARAAIRAADAALQLTEARAPGTLPEEARRRGVP